MIRDAVLASRVGSNIAVFFNILQKVFDPTPPGFEQLGCNFFDRLFKKRVKICFDKWKMADTKTHTQFLVSL